MNMIQINDEEKTSCPETEEDCIQLAKQEKQNQAYDIGFRTQEQAADDRCRGKLAEAHLCMLLHSLGFKIVHGIRTCKKFADNGCDIEVESDGKSFKIQAKTCLKHLNICNGHFATAQQKLEKLSQFNGPIVIWHESEWLIASGKMLSRMKKSKFDGFYMPSEDLKKADFSSLEAALKTLSEFTDPIEVKSSQELFIDI